jgi:putative transposase
VSDVAGRRDFVSFALLRKVSSRRACGLARVSRRRLKYASRRKEDGVLERLKELAAIHPRFGYRRLHAMLRRAGLKVNVKRVRRLCVKHGLKLSRKRRRKRRGIGAGVPCKAEHRNHVWAYDFLEDRTENGRKLRILTVEDEFTRLCLEIEVEHRMNARFVARTLLRLFEEHGVPKFIRSDNGPEFIARALIRTLSAHGVKARHIEPGSPWQNGFNERFNGSYRDECANMETFHNCEHARVLSKRYKRYYNQERPHSSLGYRTPMEFARSCGKGRMPAEAGLGLCPSPQDLSLCAPSGAGDKNGPSGKARPEHRRVVHVGAPVASQQGRILRVDGSKVTKKGRARKVPAQIGNR